MGALTSILGVFDAITEWFASTLASISSIFYSGTELTFIGVLAVLGLGIAVVTMVVAMVRSLLKGRG